ncbi:FtsK/SpoIIIE family DNA translocase [Faecalicatena contorta]|uniref:FtsK/SpoIIIE family DNA translocase n=1 Tax=Faecalicatena contorta TaxID=39482 RepID=UPI001F19E6A7|nr:DNA translocase FtsK [Faecalicatena contorta]MCF2681741.1 DNA translocase FtsK [Faecalicatena contorta]
MAGKSKKRKTVRKAKNKTTQSSFVRDEIIVWVTLAVSILILISNFGIGGFVGETISEILLKIFGWIAYAVPFLLFGMVAFLISNKENGIAYMKVTAGLIFTVSAGMLLHLINELGGLIGEKLTSVLVPAIGTAGTYVVTIILMIICMVLITGKSALKGVRSGSEKAYDRAREDARKRREHAEEKKKQKEERIKAETGRTSDDREGKGRKRSDRHVEGVSFDTTIAQKSPEVKELPVDPKEARGPEKPDFVINRAEPYEEDEIETEAQEGVSKTPEDDVADVPKKKSKMSEEGIAGEVANVAASVAAEAAKPKKPYKFPPISLLKRGKRTAGESDAHLRETAMKLQQTLQNFGVNVTITNVSCGPSVTRYELQPEMGVKVSKIVGLADDIKLNLAAADIRIEAPIPGKAAVGIEVPNKENTAVRLRDLLETNEFKNCTSKVAFAVGKDIAGNTVIADIAKMPHLLIAGATGSGKSVCINTLIMSILYKARPEEVKLLMIDPKVVELSVYNGIPHLMIPVVTDPKKAAGALNWAVAEMTRRYKEFADNQVRDMKGYNEKIRGMQDENGDPLKPMPQIVVIVDELADLMMVAHGEVEEAICRLAQLARAAGIHLVLATQRPSVDVITGLIKANMPSRIAFSVSSGVDSRTIIDMNGAEKLLGKGDMLFYPAGYQKPARVQGSFVTDSEVQEVVDYLIRQNGDATYNDEVVQHVNTCQSGGITSALEDDGRDVYFTEAGRLIIEKEKASIGMLQRAFKIGFNRAARIMDQLFEAGVVGPEEGTKPRKVLMTSEEFEQYTNQQSGRRNSEDEM